MDDFDPKLRGHLASEQLGDIYIRMRGLEEALMAVVDAIDHLSPTLLAETRSGYRLQYQERRDRSPMARSDDQALLLRYLAQRLHVLETPAERLLQRPLQDD